jgi:hypothetical protein
MATIGPVTLKVFGHCVPDGEELRRAKITWNGSRAKVYVFDDGQFHEYDSLSDIRLTDTNLEGVSQVMQRDGELSAADALVRFEIHSKGCATCS